MGRRRLGERDALGLGSIEPGDTAALLSSCRRTASVLSNQQAPQEMQEQGAGSGRSGQQF